LITVSTSQKESMFATSHLSFYAFKSVPLHLTGCTNSQKDRTKVNDGIILGTKFLGTISFDRYRFVICQKCFIGLGESVLKSFQRDLSYFLKLDKNYTYLITSLKLNKFRSDLKSLTSRKLGLKLQRYHFPSKMVNWLKFY